MESDLFFSVPRPHCKDLRAYILKRRVNKDIGQPWKLSRRDLQRRTFRGAPGCDLVSLKTKLLFEAVMVPCYQTFELQTNPMPSDSMDSKTYS